MSSPSTFSESWHRVAALQLRLRRGVKAARQMFRGERWYVIEDDLAGNYFRVRPEAWEFIARVDAGMTVEAAWKQCIDLFPETAPGQQECVNLLGQLYQSNLLHYEAGDAGELFRRQEKRRQRQLKSRLLGIMFLRIPLVDPDRFLVRMMPLVGWLISWAGALLWLAVIGWGLKTLADNWATVMHEGRTVLSPANLPLFYLALVASKLLHEMGHAFFCRKFGGEVHTLGVMMLVFTPVPYVDVTSSWSLRSRRQRVLVGAAGMIVELFLAALCVQLWARTGAGAMHAVCFNIMFITSVSTLIFNLNPLLRFDGYYILTDLLGLPNLAQRAGMHLKHLWKRWVWGLKNSRSPAVKGAEKSWLTAFGITSGIYRIFVFAAVLFFVADQFLLLGIIMMAACVIGWIIAPTLRLVRYLAGHAELDRNRARAIGTTAAIAAVVIGFLQFFPWPRHIEAQGMVQAAHYTPVITEASGYITRIHGDPGTAVKTGDILFTLSSPELLNGVERARAVVEELETRLRVALSKEPAALQPLEKRLAAAHDNLAELEHQAACLTVTAKQDGIWSFAVNGGMDGMWIPRGTPLGLIVDPSQHEFSGVVLQEDSGYLRTTTLSEMEVRLRGQAGTAIPITTEALTLDSGSRSYLPSAKLGALAGGDIPVTTDDQTGRRAAEPFFPVKATLPPTDGVKLLHGQLGTLRLRAGSEPLLPRWVRSFRQFLQKRYQVL
jgi:putative peptide zinc metalloprotease protein